MKTKAAILVKHNEPLQIIDDIEIPALKRGQVLVKIFYTGICHSQLMEINGLRGDDPWLPHMLGHEATAKVIELGEDVSTVSVDDIVILSWIKGSGIDAGGAKYKHGKQIINAGAVTTFSEYAVVSENRCTKMPEHLPMDIACLLGCAVMTGYGAVANTLKPSSGKSIAIFGLGGIGLSSLVAAIYHKMYPIITIDINDEKLELAKSLGATHIINSNKDDPIERIYEICDGGVDYSLDASGLVKVIEQAFKSVQREKGFCLFASHPPQGDKIKIDPFDLICGKRIQGTWGGECLPDNDIPKIAKLYKEGLINLDFFISEYYSLDTINDGINALMDKKENRAIVKITD